MLMTLSGVISYIKMLADVAERQRFGELAIRLITSDADKLEKMQSELDIIESIIGNESPLFEVAQKELASKQKELEIKMSKIVINLKNSIEESELA
jgi:capsule polysaccharide export protein KpsE/RkpR